MVGGGQFQGRRRVVFGSEGGGFRIGRWRFQGRRGAVSGSEGIYRSSLDARKPQNPIYSEEHQGHLQGVLYST
eukprot:4904977-Pyramimonas_sp.AAC.1